MEAVRSSKSEESDLLHCIWMEAGFVSYRLCDRELACELCPFDIAMRQRDAVPPKQPASRTGSGAPAIDAAALSPEEQFERVATAFFDPLLAMKLPGDRLYHRNHTWIQNDESPQPFMGLDHVGAYLLHSSSGIVLPQTPTHVEVNSPCAWLVLQDSTLAIHSPISGTITHTNPALAERPTLIYEDPYHAGWIARFTDGDAARHTGELLQADDFLPMVRQQIGGLRTRFESEFRRLRPENVVTMMDGGEPLRNLQGIFGHKKYVEFVGRLFAGS